MGKLKVKVDSAVFQGNGKKCHVEFRLDSKVLAKTNPINTNKKVQETSFNESHTIDINESDELIVELAGYGASQFKVALLKLTKGEEKKYPLKFEGAELILYWTALDFGHEVVKKKAPAPNLAALPPMPDEAEVERQFVEVARNTNLNLATMSKMSTADKWKLVIGYKSTVQHETADSKPQYWVTKLKHDVTPATLDKVIFHVKAKGIDWLAEFHKLGGISLLCEMLDERLKQKSHDDDAKAMMKKIVTAISSVMNNVKGFELVLKAIRPIEVLALCINEPSLDDEAIMTVVKLLAAACNPQVPGGHKTVLRAMTKYAYLKREKARFEHLVKALAASEKKQKWKKTTILMAFINMLINSPQHDFLLKRKIRSEFEALGINDILEGLSKVDIEEVPDLDTQLVLYETQKTEDDKIFKEHFGHVSDDPSTINFEDVDALFTKIKNATEKHSINPYLKEMLVDILAINPAGIKGKVKWELAHSFIRQISLQSEWIGEIDYDTFTSTEEFNEALLLRSIAHEDLLENMKKYEIETALPLRQTLEIEELKHTQASKAFKTKQIELENSNKALVEADEELKALQAEAKVVEAELEAGTPRAAEADNKVMRQKGVEAEAKIKEIQASLQKSDTRLKETNSRLEPARAASASQEKSLEALENEIHGLKIQLPTKDEQDGKKVVNPTDLAMLRGQKKDLEAQLADLEFISQNADSPVVQSRLKDREAVIVEISEHIARLEADIKLGTKAFVGKLPVDLEIEALEEERDKYSNEIPKLTKDVDALQAKLTKLQADLAAAQSSGGGGGGEMARGGPPPPGGAMVRGGPPPPGGGMARGGPPPPPGGGDGAMARGGPPPPGGGMARGGPPPPGGGGDMARGGPPPPGGRGGPPPPPGGRGGPPPPPGGRGGPPPPGGRGGPPPPGGRGGPPAAARGPTFPAVPNPKEKVKPFNWVKMPNLKISGTLFERFGTEVTPGLVDFSKIESAFQVKEVVKKEATDKPTGPPKPVIATFLDPKVAQNLNIWLNKYKAKGNAAVIQATKDIEADFFGAEPAAAVIALKGFVPSEDELSNINEYLSAGPPNEWKLLGTAEQFAHDFGKVPQLADRLQCFQYMVEFPSKKDDLAPFIKTLRAASEYVAKDAKIMRFLEIVLHIGNFLNNGNKRLEKAGGFSFDTFAALHNAKTSDNKSTMFEVIVDMIRDQKPELCQYPQAEADLVTAGSKVNLQNTEAEFRKLKAGLTTVTNLAPKITPADPEDKFQGRMEKFLKEATIEVEQLEKDFTAANAAFEMAVTQYSEDPKKMGPEEFFATWVAFVTKILESNAKFQKAELEKEKQRKRDEAAAKKATSPAATRGGAAALAAEAAAGRGALRGATRGATRGGARGGPAPEPEEAPATRGATRGTRGVATRGGARGRGGLVADSLFDDLTAGNVFKR